MAYTYTIGFKADTKQIATALNDIKQDIDDLTTASGRKMSTELAEGVRQANILSSALEKAQTDKGTSFATMNNYLKSAGTSAGEMAAALQNAGMHRSVTTLLSSFSSANTQVVTLNKHLQETVKVLGQSVKYNMAMIFQNFAIGQIQQAVYWVKDLDSALSDIAVVAPELRSQLDLVSNSILTNASTLRVAASEYAEAALLFYQQGLSMEEVEERTEYTIKAAKAAGTSVTEMSEQLTAIWNTYQMEGEELERAASIAAKLGAETAASFADIAEGMQIAASGAAILGVSYESLAAQMATIKEVSLQSSSVIATALKTIYARFSNLSTSGEDAGESLGLITQGLADMGVNVLDQSGNLRDLDDVINQLGVSWDTYSRNQQIAIAQIVGGTRQYQQFLSLMQNFDMYQTNLASAESEDGTELTAQYLETLKTIDSAMINSAEAWQEAFGGLFNSDSQIWFHNLLEDIGDLVGGITNSFSNLGSVFSVVGAIFAKQIGEKVYDTGVNIDYWAKSLSNTSSVERVSKVLEDVERKTGSIGTNLGLTMGAIKEGDEAARGGGSATTQTDDTSNNIATAIKETAEVSTEIDDSKLKNVATQEELNARLAQQEAERQKAAKDGLQTEAEQNNLLRSRMEVSRTIVALRNEEQRLLDKGTETQKIQARASLANLKILQEKIDADINAAILAAKPIEKAQRKTNDLITDSPATGIQVVKNAFFKDIDATLDIAKDISTVIQVSANTEEFEQNFKAAYGRIASDISNVDNLDTSLKTIQQRVQVEEGNTRQDLLARQEAVNDKLSIATTNRKAAMQEMEVAIKSPEVTKDSNSKDLEAQREEIEKQINYQKELIVGLEKIFQNPLTSKDLESKQKKLLKIVALAEEELNALRAKGNSGTLTDEDSAKMEELRKTISLGMSKVNSLKEPVSTERIEKEKQELQRLEDASEKLPPADEPTMITKTIEERQKELDENQEEIDELENEKAEIANQLANFANDSSSILQGVLDEKIDPGEDTTYRQLLQNLGLDSETLANLSNEKIAEMDTVIEKIRNHYGEDWQSEIIAAVESGDTGALDHLFEGLSGYSDGLIDVLQKSNYLEARNADVIRAGSDAISDIGNGVQTVSAAYEVANEQAEVTRRNLENTALTAKDAFGKTATAIGSINAALSGMNTVLNSFESGNFLGTLTGLVTVGLSAQAAFNSLSAILTVAAKGGETLTYTIGFLGKTITAAVSTVAAGILVAVAAVYVAYKIFKSSQEALLDNVAASRELAKEASELSDSLKTLASTMQNLRQELDEGVISFDQYQDGIADIRSEIEQLNNDSYAGISLELFDISTFDQQMQMLQDARTAAAQTSLEEGQVAIDSFNSLSRVPGSANSNFLSEVGGVEGYSEYLKKVTTEERLALQERASNLDGFTDALAAFEYSEESRKLLDFMELSDSITSTSNFAEIAKSLKIEDGEAYNTFLTEAGSSLNENTQETLKYVQSINLLMAATGQAADELSLSDINDARNLVAAGRADLIGLEDVTEVNIKLQGTLLKSIKETAEGFEAFETAEEARDYIDGLNEAIATFNELSTEAGGDIISYITDSFAWESAEDQADIISGIMNQMATLSYENTLSQIGVELNNIKQYSEEVDKLKGNIEDLDSESSLLNSSAVNDFIAEIDTMGSGEKFSLSDLIQNSEIDLFAISGTEELLNELETVRSQLVEKSNKERISDNPSGIAQEQYRALSTYIEEIEEKSSVLNATLAENNITYEEAIGLVTQYSDTEKDLLKNQSNLETSTESLANLQIELNMQTSALLQNLKNVGSEMTDMSSTEKVSFWKEMNAQIEILNSLLGDTGQQINSLSKSLLSMTDEELANFQAGLDRSFASAKLDIAIANEPVTAAREYYIGNNDDVDDLIRVEDGIIATQNRQVEIEAILNTLRTAEEYQSYIDRLQTRLEQNDLTDGSREVVQERIEELTEGLNEVTALEERLKITQMATEALQVSFGELSETVSELEVPDGFLSAELTAELTAFGKALAEASDQDYEDIDKIADYYQHLGEQAAEAGKDINGVSADIADNRKAALVAASAMEKINKAVDDIADNYEDWSDALNNSTDDLNTQALTLQEVENALKDLLGISQNTDFSTGFMSNVEILELMKSAADGSIDAYETLQELAGNDLTQQLITSLAPEDFTALNTSMDEYLNTVLSVNDEIRASAAGLALGEGMTLSGEVTKTLNDFFAINKMTVDQVQDYMLTNYGVTPDLELGSEELVTGKELLSTTTTVTGTDWDEDTGRMIGWQTVETPNYSEEMVSQSIPKIAVNADGTGKVTKSIAPASTKTASSSSSSSSSGPKATSSKRPATVDRYKDTNTSISKASASVTKLNSLEDQAFGTTKLALISNKNTLLQEQAQTYTALIKEAQDYYNLDDGGEGLSFGIDADGMDVFLSGTMGDADRLQQKLDAFMSGTSTTLELEAEFNEDGFVANAEEMQRKMMAYLEDFYNSNTYQTLDDDGNKIELFKTDALEAQYEMIMSQFDSIIEQMELVDTTAQTVLDNIQSQLDAIFEWLQNKIDEAEYKAELRISINERDLRIIDQTLGLLGDEQYTIKIDLLSESADEYTSNYRAIIDEINRYQEIMDNLDAPQFQEYFKELFSEEAWEAFQETGTPDALIQAMGDSIDELMDIQDSLYELNNQVWGTWADQLQTIADDFDNLTSKFDSYESMMSSLVDIWEIGGTPWADQSYSIDLMNNSLAIQQNQLESLVISSESLNLQLERTQSLYEQSLETNGAESQITQDYLTTIEELQQSILEAKADILSDTASLLSEIESVAEAAAQVIVNTFTTALEAVFADISSATEMYSQYSALDNYYVHEETAGNTIYQMLAEAQTALSEVTDPTQLAAYAEWETYLNSLIEERTVLTEIMGEEQEHSVWVTKEGVELTEAQLEIMQAEFELAKTQAEWEDAQAAKDTMRLARDASGNWSYVYSADSTEEEDAENLTDIQQQIADIRELHRVASAEASEAWLSTWVEYQEYMANVDQSRYAQDEAYKAEVDQRAAWYTEQLDKYSATITYHNSAVGDSFDETALGVITDMDNMEEANEKYQKNVEEMFVALNENYDDYQTKVEQVLGAVGLEYDELADSIDQYSEEIMDANDATTKSVEDMAIASTAALEATYSTITEWGNKWAITCRDVIAEIDAAVAAYQDMVKEMSGGDEGYSYDSNANYTQQNIDILAGLVAGDSISQGTANSVGTSMAQKVVDAVADGTFDALKFNGYYDEDLTVDQLAKANTIDVDLINGSVDNIAEKIATSTGNELYFAHLARWYKLMAYSQNLLPEEDTAAIQKWLEASGEQIYTNFSDYLASLDGEVKYTVPGYQTGGLALGPQLATLAEDGKKELVLNSTDTENILTAVEIMRDKVARYINNLGNTQSSILNSMSSSIGSSEILQPISIYADFPNVTARDEIEAAFANLVNQSKQYNIT